MTGKGTSVIDKLKQILNRGTSRNTGLDTSRPSFSLGNHRDEHRVDDDFKSGELQCKLQSIYILCDGRRTDHVCRCLVTTRDLDRSACKLFLVHDS